MRLVDGESDGGRAVRWSSRDLVRGAACEHGVLVELDVTLGRRAPLPRSPDPVRGELARLSERRRHELVHALRHDDVVDLGTVVGAELRDVPADDDTARWVAYERASQHTLEALRSDARAVQGGMLTDGGVVAPIGLLVRGPDDRWRAVESTLAHAVRSRTSLRLGVVAALLDHHAIPRSDDAEVVLGTDEHRSHELAGDVAEALAVRRRLDALASRHLAGDAPARWREPGVRRCGRCDACDDDIRRHRDVLLVPRVPSTYRALAGDAGLTTIDQVAAAHRPPPTLQTGAWRQLHDHAALCVEAQPEGPWRDDGPLLVRVRDRGALDALPPADDGDVFFDFEGDPLWDDGAGQTGLEYLFGLVEAPDGDYRAFWAHDRAAERTALTGFVDWLGHRLEAHPGLHVYHYASYETVALRRLAERHDTAVGTIDGWVRDGLFVDLYTTVSAALVLSSRSYGLKAVERAYLDRRSGDVTTAGGSIAAYGDHLRARDRGDASTAREVLERIRAYNHDDCRSTMLLASWLRGL